MPDPSEQLPATTSQQVWQRATASGHFRVEATTDDILRLAFTPIDAPPHRTWSLASSAANLSAAAVEIDDQGEIATLRTNALQVSVSLGLPDSAHSMRIRIARNDGSVIIENGTAGLSDTGQPRWTSALASGERVYGGGERTGPLDKRGRSLTFWATDPPPNHGEQTDAMYQSVPFLIGLVDGKAHGIYFDVNERAVADIGESTARQPHLCAQLRRSGRVPLRWPNTGRCAAAIYRAHRAHVPSTAMGIWQSAISMGL